MKDKILKTATNIVAIVLLVVSVVLVILMYVGPGEEIVNEASGDALMVPNFTDALIYWTYALLIATAAVAIGFALVKFVKNLIANPKGSIKTIVTLVAFVLIFVVAWNLGSPDKITIFGYEGNQNEGFWAQLTDMIIYATYTLFALIILAIVGTRIYVKLK